MVYHIKELLNFTDGIKVNNKDWNYIQLRSVNVLKMLN